MLLPLEGCCCWRWGGAQASNKPSLCGAHLQIIGYLAREPLIVNCWIHNISTEKLIFKVITHLLSINTTLQMANMYIYIYYTVDIKLDIPWFRVDIYHGICFLMVFCKSKYINQLQINIPAIIDHAIAMCLIFVTFLHFSISNIDAQMQILVAIWTIIVNYIISISNKLFR